MATPFLGARANRFTSNALGSLFGGESIPVGARAVFAGLSGYSMPPLYKPASLDGRTIEGAVARLQESVKARQVKAQVRRHYSSWYALGQTWRGDTINNPISSGR
jgi:hypothetical protein